MGQLENILKTMINGNEEAEITAVTVNLTPTLFTSQLTSGFPRKAVWAHNNSAAASGECFYGYAADMTPYAKSRPIPKGSAVEIPVTTNIPFYLCCLSGETGDVRIEEIA